MFLKFTWDRSFFGVNPLKNMGTCAGSGAIAWPKKQLGQVKTSPGMK